MTRTASQKLLRSTSCNSVPTASPVSSSLRRSIACHHYTSREFPPPCVGMVRVTEASGAEQQRVVDRNLILFPAYWDAKRTVAKGRRVPVELASEYVTLQDVAECLTMLGLPLGMQKKAYCRDVLTQAVRLRVPLRNEMGILINPQIDSRACVSVTAAALCWG